MSPGLIRLVDVRGASVRVGEVRVGSVSDVFADAVAERIVGLEVSGPDGRRWFLPWAASSVDAGIVRSPSTLVLLGSEQLAFYARHGMRLLRDDLEALSVAVDGQVMRSLDGSTSVLAAAGEGMPLG